MSILRTYFTAPGASRPTQYREAWWDEFDQEFVVHHGTVGTQGTTKTETLNDPDLATQLLEEFNEKCAQEGFVEIPAGKMDQLVVIYKLKGETPLAVEETLVGKLGEQITRALAWRGLGAVESEERHPGQVHFNVATVHPRKAREIIPGAVKSAGVQAAKVNISPDTTSSEASTKDGSQTDPETTP